MIEAAALALSTVTWDRAVRIIRSAHPPIDLFEDIADPADWPLLIAAEQKTNPRLVESIGNIDLVPPERRVGGPGASYLMSPFTHASEDRPSRFSDGTYGVLYAGNMFEVALLETIYHHGRFMRQTSQEPGWTSQFREIVLKVDGDLHDLRTKDPDVSEALRPDDYAPSQQLGKQLRGIGSNGIVYPSVRYADGACVALFYPDFASNPIQGRHLDYHWNGETVDLYRDAASGHVVRIA